MRLSGRKVAIVTPDVMGPRTCGGIGTACKGLAELLVQAGCVVTLVIVDDREPIAGNEGYWRKRYARKGIRLVFLRHESPPLDCMTPGKSSYTAYRFLLGEDFEIVHFVDMRGLGYYSMLAKRLGLAFRKTSFAVTLSGPLLWHYLENQQAVTEVEDIAQDFIERKSVEFAETLFAPTRYIVDWVKSRGWVPPKNTIIAPHVIPSFPELRGNNTFDLPLELVFFGRLETRKGLEIFCEAIDRLPPSVRSQIEITFLGWYGKVGGELSFRYLNRHFRNKPWSWRIIPSYDQEQAIHYLRTRNVLAIIPSRAESFGYTAVECISAGIPFLASRIPAFEELISRQDHDRVLFENTPEALADKIMEFLNENPRSHRKVGFSFDPKRGDLSMLDWHRKARARKSPAPARKPRISVCVTHRNRPNDLLLCLKAIRSQTLSPDEVILVDDASDTTEANAVMHRLRDEFRHSGWTLLENRKRLGRAASRNIAASQARGDYLIFIDEDQFPRPEELRIFSECAARSGADILTCAFDRFRGAEFPDRLTAIESRSIPLGDAVSVGLYQNIFGEMHALIRRSCFAKLGGLKEGEGETTDNGEFFARAVLAGSALMTIPEALFWSRTRHGRPNLSLCRRNLSQMSPYRKLFPKECQPMLELALGLATRPRTRPLTIELSPRGSRSPLDQRRFFPIRLFSTQKGQVIGPGKTRAKAAALRLPTFPRPKKGRMLIELNLVAMGSGVAEVSCGELRSQTLGFEFGHRRVQLVLEPVRSSAPLLLRFSDLGGKLHLKKVEIYAEDR